MAKLSVNINKVATLRNARGGNLPNVLQFALDCERFGAEGITVHPRPDERHITRKDTYDLASAVETEFNIEGYPDERFMQMLRDLKPTQATLVPDGPDQLTSDAGWNTTGKADFLKPIIDEIKALNIRVSVFVDPQISMVEGAANIGADRIELYTGPYAHDYSSNPQKAIEKYVEAAKKAKELGLGLNAGHDLNLDNLKFFKQEIPWLEEVSIGHALISDALYYGIENTIGLYKQRLS